MTQTFSYKGAARYLSREKVRQEIIESLESSKAFRDEIRRVFQVANRRIQNIENKGIFSPAVQALNLGSGYTKFGFTGKSWQELKRDYSKAVSFLKQPTSTLTGATEYNKAIQKKYNLTNTEFNALMSDYLGKAGSLAGSDFVEKYLKRYKDFTNEYESEARNAAAQLESESIQLQNELEQQINAEANAIANGVNSAIDIVKGLKL